MKLNFRELLNAVVLALVIGFCGYVWAQAEDHKQLKTDFEVHKAEEAEKDKNTKDKLDENLTETRETKKLVQELLIEIRSQEKAAKKASEKESKSK